MKEMLNYDPRYLAGILLFNDHDYFEAHEVWEDLWAESHGADWRFVQGLIQAAVGLFHFSGGNLGGAVKLYRTSREYMMPCGSPFWGLDVQTFWQQMERCFRPLLENPAPDRRQRPDPALLPVLGLEPPPEMWPEPADFLPPDED